MSWLWALVLFAGAQLALKVVRDRLSRRDAAAAEGQMDVVAAVRAFRKRDWNTLEALYLDRAPSDRYHFLRGLGTLTKRDSALPPSATPNLVIIAAGVCVGWAWRHRGSGVGASVSERAFVRFTRLLDQAAALLDAVEPNVDSVGRALRIRIEMGLSGGRGILQRQLNAANELPERNIFVALNHIMFVTPKWHGSVDEMLEVARGYAAGSADVALIALPAVAHAEAWLYLTLMSNNFDDKRAGFALYMQNDEFTRELESMDDAFWRARTAADAPIPHAELMLAHNYLAYLLYRKGIAGRLARHLDVIDRDLWETPWAYVGIDAHSDSAPDTIRKWAG